MGIWHFVYFALIIGVVANDKTPPNNQAFSSIDVSNADRTRNPYSESRMLERVEHLSRAFSENIKVLNDRVDELMGKVSEQMKSFQTSTTHRLSNLEHKLERLPADTGVYIIQPDISENVTFEVSRDWTNNHGFGGNWIVFQRRFNGSVNFYRNWTEYKEGFGDLRGEHWLGLEKLHAIEKTRKHELLIVLEDFDGVIAYAHYDDFRIGDESEKYALKSLGQYTGTAGDSLAYHKGGSFTTYDQDNDESTVNCAQSYVGAWWFRKCYDGHLNGQYLSGKSKLNAGIIWYRFRGLSYSLKSTKMMIRPVA